MSHYTLAALRAAAGRPRCSVALAALVALPLWLLPQSESAAGDQARFGERVEATTSALFISAPGHGGHGRVYVLEQASGRWHVQQVIDPESLAAGSGFGSALASEGSLLTVGEPGSGSILVYRRTSGIWSREARLRDDRNPSLGGSVDVSGSTIVAGAPDQGSATIFVREEKASDDPWTIGARLQPSDGASGFGAAVAIDGDRVVVSQAGTTSGSTHRGALHLFERDEDGWGRGETIASGSSTGDGFGRAIDLLGDTLLVGAPNARRAYVYTRDDARWRRSAQLDATLGADSAFGNAVSLSARAGSAQVQAVVGAPLASVGSRREAGAATVYFGRGSDWHDAGTLSPINQLDAHSGWDVAASGSRVVVGIPDLGRAGEEGGGVALYETDVTTGWSLSDVLDADTPIASGAPIIDPTVALVFDEGQSASLRIRLNDPDTAIDALVVLAQSSDESVLEDRNISVNDAPGGRRLDLDPDSDAHGTFALIVRVSDGGSVTSRRVPVEIRAVNDAPAFELAADPNLPPRPGRGERWLPDFIRGFDPGPREFGQSILEALLQKTSDPAGVVVDATLHPSASGETAHLSLKLSGRSGTAHFSARVRDSGGVADAGRDLSPWRTFSVSVQTDPDTLLLDGFE
jgi:hypothetical protein